MDINSRESYSRNKEIVLSKPLLRAFYRRAYEVFTKNLVGLRQGPVVELGSGGGFIKEVLPQVITSDILSIRGVDLELDARNLPFRSSSLSAILMLNVFHHVQNIEEFLREAERTLVNGGKIVMIEPANTTWARLVYRNLHHEPFDSKQSSWSLPKGGPMSVANGALPWIVFRRDIKQFESRFPRLRLIEFENFAPLSYLLSGGLSFPQLLPNIFANQVLEIESGLKYLNSVCGMFCRIVLVRA